MKLRGCRTLLAALALLSCGDEDARVPEAKTDSGAHLLALSGTVLRLGSDDPAASPEEVPGWTRFEHDAWMDASEVTQAEYRALTGRDPFPIRGDDLPATDVSWYDAILCANARSRRDGLDTIYEYAGASRDSTGSVWNLQGLAVHLDRNGWRLPTESEWEAAARAGGSAAWAWGAVGDSASASAYAWYAGNSGERLHPVGAKEPNAWGFHDMAGNAMEWVGDWKGSFPSDTVPDYAGLESAADIPEIALKGGSFRHGLAQLRPSSRSATYAAFRSTRADYVGFRLARGGFVARFATAQGGLVQVPPVSIPVDLASAVGAAEARLVFVNRSGGRGVLSWIEYGTSNPVMRSLPDSEPAFHPAIGPDGRWVAWCTALEGSTGPSRIRARRLAAGDTNVLDLGEGAIPRWWTDGADTFLVRAHALDNTSPSWIATRTTARRWSNGGLVGAEVVWSASGSYHDGRSGPYLFSGYRRLRRLDLRDGRDRILFVGPENGKAAGDTSQVCNVSASPDASGRSLFLDFGSAEASTLVGRPYGIHEIAFLADSTGAVSRWFPAPSGESQWDHLEWSNGSRWAASGAVDPANARRNLYLIDLDSARAIRIASGEDLWQPALWIGEASAPASGVDSDSAGAWNSPATDYAQEEFAIKARAYWLVRERIEIAAIGSSRVKAGIAPEVFSRGKAFNWGVSGGDPVSDRRVFEGYVLPQSPKLKVVVLSLMPGWLFWIRGDLLWNHVSATVGYRYDAGHGFWRDGLPSGFLDAVAARTWSASSLYDTMGGTKVDPHWWNTGATPPCEPPPTEDFSGEVFQRNWADLTAIVDTCRARRIHLVLVNFPQDPAYAKTACMGKYGPTWATWAALKGRIQALGASNPWFHFLDAHADGAHDYAPEAATNFDHLSWIGAAQLSRRLDSLIAMFPPASDP